MADTKLTADSAARLDPIPHIARPPCPHGYGAIMRVCARTTA